MAETDMEKLQLEEEEYDEKEGVPKASDPFIQKYFEGRDALVIQEEKHRSDRDFKELLSPMAQEACAIVNQIRFEERQTVWTDQLEDELSKKTGSGLYPGMMFTLAKDRMEQTKLWKIMRKMPKGSLLHCHLEAMIDQDWLFREAVETEGLHLLAASSLDTKQKLEIEDIEFQFRSSTPPETGSVWTSQYIPEAAVPLKLAADSFPDGGREGFISWIRSRCSIGAEESLCHHHGSNKIWKKFTSCFGILRFVVYYEPIFRKFVTRMFTQLAEDGVQWVDIRAGFHFEYFKQGSEKPEDDYLEMFRVLGEEIEKFQNTEQGKNFWGARMIWTSLRFLDNEAIGESMKKCIQTKLAYPDLVAGYDLVGHEDPGRSLSDLTPLLFWFRKRCTESGVSIPFYFHAGETLGTGSEADGNLFDAIALGTRRLGHAFSLYKHPLLMNMVRDRRICVECCPISNEILRFTSSILSHPLPALLAQGVPVALCNDDPGVLGQNDAGMSHDFYQALQGIESLGLEGLASMAENSVRWSTFDDLESREWTEDIKLGLYGEGVRAQRMKEWRRQWEKFCQWVVMEYGVEMNEDPEE